MDKKPGPLAGISRGAADALFQIALIARQDGDDVREFLFDSAAIWRELDRECLHPSEITDHAHS